MVMFAMVTMFVLCAPFLLGSLSPMDDSLVGGGDKFATTTGGVRTPGRSLLWVPSDGSVSLPSSSSSSSSAAAGVGDSAGVMARLRGSTQHVWNTAHVGEAFHSEVSLGRAKGDDLLAVAPSADLRGAPSLMDNATAQLLNATTGDADLDPHTRNATVGVEQMPSMVPVVVV
jgi:hypothetical protein